MGSIEYTFQLPSSLKDKMRLKIEKLTEWDALFQLYPGQCSPQDCYLELDCETGELSASYDVQVGGGLPPNVYWGHARRYTIPCLTAEAVNDLMKDIAPLARRILKGYGTKYDGNQ